MPSSGARRASTRDRMRIGIVKPDWGIVGGFELVMERVALELELRGHTIEWFTVDARNIARRAFGIAIPDEVWDEQPEFFHYLALADAFSLMRLDTVDLVISTQPPSYAIQHPRHLALFSHHLRMYYDLCDVWVEGRIAGDPRAHLLAAELIRVVDHDLLRRPQYILAASDVVKGRLRVFNGLDETVGVYHAGVGVPTEKVPSLPGKHAVCVSRHEFPKRTELFVHAMKLLPHVPGVAVGGGARLGYVRSVDALLARMSPEALADVDDRALWLRRHDNVALEEPAPDSNVSFVGHVDDPTLRQLYAEAVCVVAPAYDEDYGLTAIESMHYGKPLVVCSDGGGLVDFVDDGVNGLVVEPSGPALAEAINRLHEDRGLAEKLGEAARRTAHEYTWERAMKQIENGISRICS